MKSSGGHSPLFRRPLMRRADSLYLLAVRMPNCACSLNLLFSSFPLDAAMRADAQEGRRYV
jgi:hypothetical protein